jgi:hypothetical protein
MLELEGRRNAYRYFVSELYKKNPFGSTSCIRQDIIKGELREMSYKILSNWTVKCQNN